MAQVTFSVEFDDFGQAIIRLPDGRSQQVDAAKVADITDKLSKALGTVKERHIGDHVHHHGEGAHTHEHQHGGQS